MRMIRLLSMLGVALACLTCSAFAQELLPPIESCPAAAAGDVDCSGAITSADIVRVVNYVFRGGLAPCHHPLLADVDLSGAVNASDVIGLVDHVFRSGAAPGDICAAVFGDSALAVEAEIMAMAYGGEVRAPDELKWKIYIDLKRIREGFRSTIPQVDSVGFFPPWWPGRLLLSVDSATYAAIAAGTYTAWDSLNALYEPVSAIPQQYGGIIDVRFYETLNPTALAKRYALLPGVTGAYADRWLGDWPNVYRLADGDVAAYIFRQAWGDCPMGCIESRFWYFLATPGGIEYKGYAEPPMTVSGWWPIAAAAMEAYRQL